jgi:cytidine deaminase
MEKTGLLFDMDGVLVDSEKVITAAAIEALKRFSIFAKEADFKEFTGMGEVRFIGGVAEKYGRAYRPEMKALTYEIYGEMVDEHLSVYENTLPTLEALAARGYPLALASSADLVKVRHNLRVAQIPLDWFGAIVTAEDAERKKPWPDLFIKAAEGLGLSPDQCVAFDDAVSGVRAAAASRAVPVGVCTSFSEEVLLGAGARYTVQEIGGIPALLNKILKDG